MVDGMYYGDLNPSFGDLCHYLTIDISRGNFIFNFYYHEQFIS